MLSIELFASRTGREKYLKVVAWETLKTKSKWIHGIEDGQTQDRATTSTLRIYNYSCPTVVCVA